MEAKAPRGLSQVNMILAQWKMKTEGPQYKEEARVTAQLKSGLNSKKNIDQLRERGRKQRMKIEHHMASVGGRGEREGWGEGVDPTVGGQNNKL